MSLSDEKEPAAPLQPNSSKASTLNAPDVDKASSVNAPEVDNAVDIETAEPEKAVQAMTDADYPHGLKLVLLSGAALVAVFLIALDQVRLCGLHPAIE